MGVDGPARRAAWLAARSLVLLLCLGAAHAQPRPETLATCAQCHGPSGNAPDPAVPSLAGQPQRFIENQLVLIREGLRDIPLMQGVMASTADAEIVALATHYAAQAPRPNPGALQPPKAQRGAELSRRGLCGTCHLPNYAGQMQVPRLAGQNEAYLLLAMRQFRDHPGPGRDTIMSASLQGLSDLDLGSLAHYLAHVKP